MADSFTFYRGQTMLPTLEAVSGDLGEVSSITAKMRLSISPHTMIAVDIQAREAAPDGWDLSLTEAVSKSLQCGLWQLDARLEVGTSIVITASIGVDVVLSASGG